MRACLYFVITGEAAMQSPCRDADRVRGLRGWRAEKRKSVMVSAIFAGSQRAPLGAPHALK
jgi:hypothetical protein